MDVPVASDLLAFDDWRFDQRTKVLLRRDAYGSWEEVAMGSRAREVLALLLEQPGALVPKDEIMNAVWSRVVVEFEQPERADRSHPEDPRRRAGNGQSHSDGSRTRLSLRSSRYPGNRSYFHAAAALSGGATV